MSLPYELTTFPSQALDILRYLASRENGAAYDGDIMEALDQSDRAFGKAIRRLVTKEYVEMQYDGAYALTRRGRRAAETLAAYDQSAEETIEADAPAGSAADEALIRRLLAAFPKTIPVGQPAYLFVRVDAPTPGELPLSEPLELLVRLRTACAVTPQQQNVSIPPDSASSAARFVVTAPAAGTYPVTVETLQVGMMDLLEAGTFQLELTAAPAAANTFRVRYFDLLLQPGI